MTDDELIQRHIAERGVTRCPTAACAPTSGAVSEADQAAVRDRDPVGDAWRRKHGLARRRGARKGVLRRNGG